jgi:hypothetical protein
LHKSVLDNDQRLKQMELNHIIYGEEQGIIHSLSYGMLTFLSVVRCRKEIGKFYRENEHFRELLNAMKHKYGARSVYQSRDPSIGCALDQIVNVMFHRHERKKKRYHQQQSTKHYPRNRIQDEEEEGSDNRKCSNSLCQIIENHVSYRRISKFHLLFILKQMQFQDCPHCHQLSYCSQYCREVHWTLTHNISCRSVNQNNKKDQSTVLCMIDRFSGVSPLPYQDDKTVSISHNSVFETLPVQISQPIIDATTEMTNDLCCPSSSSSSSTDKKKSFKTLLSFLRVSRKRR